MSALKGAGTVAQLEKVCLLATELPGSVSVQLAGDEDLLRALARRPGAQTYGLVSLHEGPPRVWWSVAVQLDHVRVAAGICRPATRAEIRAVTRWQPSGVGKTGVLYVLVERELLTADVPQPERVS